MANGTVNREIFRMVIPAWVDRAVLIQFRTEISRNLRQRGTANRIFFEWNSNFRSERTDRKSGPPRKVDLLFRKFPDWSEPFHSVSDRNFRKFWLNGKRPNIVSPQCHEIFLVYTPPRSHATDGYILPLTFSFVTVVC